MPPHWMPYFTTASLDEAIARVKDVGSAVHAGPIDSAGRICMASDPQGAFFGLYEGDVDDWISP